MSSLILTLVGRSQLPIADSPKSVSSYTTETTPLKFRGELALEAHLLSLTLRYSAKPSQLSMVVQPQVLSPLTTLRHCYRIVHKNKIMALAMIMISR